MRLTSIPMFTAALLAIAGCYEVPIGEQDDATGGGRVGDPSAVPACDSGLRRDYLGPIPLAYDHAAMPAPPPATAVWDHANLFTREIVVQAEGIEVSIPVDLDLGGLESLPPGTSVRIDAAMDHLIVTRESDGSLVLATIGAPWPLGAAHLSLPSTVTIADLDFATETFCDAPLVIGPYCPNMTSRFYALVAGSTTVEPLVTTEVTFGAETYRVSNRFATSTIYPPMSCAPFIPAILGVDIVEQVR